MHHFFSIVIPTYNRPQPLFEIISIIQHQTFPDWELLIVDDSRESLEPELMQLSDSRIAYYHRGEKLGVSSARNVGAKHAQGRYLVFIDDDDRVTENWLEDFATLAQRNDYPDVLFCGMEIINPLTHKKETYQPGSELWRFIFPGSWAITKTLFETLGGYDERLLFGENTELFFRIRGIKPQQAMTEAVNFFYYPSVDGGSKNIQNKIESTKIMLEKHKEFFATNTRVERLLVQVLGISFLRLKQYKEARQYLFRAYVLNPFQLKTLLRLLISFLPFVSRKIYKPA
jgi:glycosyltransferase involved in cell wall biosynthesis